MKKILFCLLGIVAFIGCSKNEMHKTYVDTRERPDYLQNLMGVWEASAEGGQRFEYVIINNNSIMMYPRDVAGESYSQPIKGVYAHDQHALYVTLMNHRHSGEKNEELPRKITIPYTMSADVTFTTGTLTLELDGRIISLVKKRGWPNARRRQSLLDGEWKSVKARKEATDMSMTVCFSEKNEEAKRSSTSQKTGLYNLSKPNWEERPEYLHNLNGDWENGENSVSFTDSQINFCCIENDDWYIVNGLFTADEHNLYISIQDGNSLSVKYDSTEQVIPYTLSEHGNSFELNLKFAGKIFKFKKISNSVLPRRRQNGLNGIWKSEKAWKKATDWNITLKFLEESFLIKIEGGFFSYSLLGDVFYERGMMFITKIHDVENEYYPADVKFGKDFRSSNYDYAIDYVVDYAAQHELPEYIFLGARLDSPYHSLCNYRVEKDTLTIMAYDKEINLYKLI